MPNRVIREGILDSERVNKLSWPAEVFYRRLMSVVDDYGRYDARHDLLRAKLYPLKLDRVSASDIDKWLTECVNADLVRCYEVKGKKYLELSDFNQSVRIKQSKWPPPEVMNADASICKQMHANDFICMSESKRNETETKRKYIKVRGQVFLTTASEFCKEHLEIFLSEWRVKNPNVSAEDVFKKMDEEYICYDFADENHVKNSFKKAQEKLKRESIKIQNPKPGATKSGMVY